MNVWRTQTARFCLFVSLLPCLFLSYCSKSQRKHKAKIWNLGYMDSDAGKNHEKQGFFLFLLSIKKKSYIKT